MLRYAPVLGQVRFRPMLGQYDYQPPAETVGQKISRLNSTLRDTVNLYLAQPFSASSADQLNAKADTCRALIANIAIASDVAAAEADANACLADLKSTLKNASDAGYAAKTAANENAFKINMTVLGVVAAASFGVSAYHGYKRNKNSVGWGAWWGFMGLLFPVVTPVVAIAEGYGKRAK